MICRRVRRYQRGNHNP